jgi:hypothetical protein
MLEAEVPACREEREPWHAQPEPRPWIIAGAPAALAAMAPLIAARRARQPVLELTGDVERLLARPARHLPPGTEAVLVIGSRRGSPRRTIRGLFLRDAAGTRVPLGWLPDAGPELAVYARAAARVLERAAVPSSDAARAEPARARGPVIILGQWEDRFLRVSLRTARRLARPAPGGVAAFHWTADRISRLDMLSGLACGPAAAMYFGHGRPAGWAGYHGVRGEHFAEPWPEPIGALVALCCENASRSGVRLSFAETLALRGVVAGALAAVAKTRHDHNRRLGPALCEALVASPPGTLAEWLLALPAEEWERTPFRFIGDPAAPLLAAPFALERAAKVFAPAPGDELPPWDETGDAFAPHERDAGSVAFPPPPAGI